MAIRIVLGTMSLQALLGSTLLVKHMDNPAMTPDPLMEKIPGNCKRGFNCGITIDNVGDGPVSINCTDAHGKTTERWFARGALLVRGHGGATGLYCAVPKVATSTMFSMMHFLGAETNPGKGSDNMRFASYRTVKDIVHEQDSKGMQQVCAAYSFVIIRNPWDRLVSGYVDKVLTKDLFTNIVPFDNFVKKVSKSDPKYFEPHFRPVSFACATTGEQRHKYNKVIKLENGNFESKIADLFVRELKFPKEKVNKMLALPAHSSANNSRASIDKCSNSDKGRTACYFHQSNPGLLRKVFADDIDFGHYKYAK